MRDPSPWTPRFAAPPGTLSERLARAIAEDIDSGRLRRGARLPAHRRLAIALATSVVTVGRAYDLLERRGLVRGEHGRGTFVIGVATTPLASRLMDKVIRPEGVADLSLNLPPMMIPPEAFAEAVVALARDDRLPDPSRYPPCAGWPDLRAAAGAWIADHRPSAPAEGVLLVNGAQQGIVVSLALAAEPGRPVITEAVTYPGALAAAALLGRPVVGVALDGEGMLPEALEGALMRHPGALIYLVPVLQNPTGATMGLGRRLALLEIARRHGVEVVEDDAYALLDEAAPETLYSLDPERVWYVNSFTKPLGSMLRMGVVVPPSGREAAAIRAIQGTTWTAAPLAAAVLGQWLGDGTAERVVRGLRAEAASRIAIARAIFPGLCPQGYRGLHLWLPLDEPRAERLARRAAAAGIIVTPPLAPVVDSDLAMGVRICLGSLPREHLARTLLVLRGLVEDEGECVAVV
ncbi:GntR family transcriptional regulator [Rhodospirillum rubrum]|uniref:aminotransferase-like domain-containing protein n=1 Tax=Rhodospirillum rubrum TaxID=1085 RepID=UPI0019044DDE|nr:PLP-dependent aminotransferase family protein [Rhodospirillum rubrum]MBK1664656.1 GntR family transcriptional regulator [Rhodospirillum rubrum]MBK1677753.1 GntR family transcriptional regulator [Rhodospirillum rubrum]